MDRPAKRQRTNELESLQRSISPPKKRARKPVAIPSPWQLTWIQDLPEDDNKDAVTLRDLLGDPLISECWEFNFLHDIPFLMNAFDPDTRHLVDVHLVHGFWKREDENRIDLENAAAEFKNVNIHIAPMPEMFGTHHSKMMILFRHDETAQVIIHTANMISKDWTNMTNGVWKSPLLPKMPNIQGPESSPEDYPVGSGERFKIDLLNYLKSYDKRKITCKPLSDKLKEYDFSAVRAALIASVPGRHDVQDMSETSWALPDSPILDSGRKRAAPHIKTYIRSNESTLDWGLLTSANISKQAWGEAARPTGEMRIASWEVGVLVWPELLEPNSVMVGTYRTDVPDVTPSAGEDEESRPVVGLRIPYNTPLQRYTSNEVPWVASMPHTEPDWAGRSWE
ncbi:hypothetical protein NW766_002134 [Fusarium irregulare]|uniref:Tyrosyl-DNA phosphodiesterase n=1 Tax=Fusarium irregulare TaxID=2494466 RepID=A0A9W8UE05_9HYPO|nr:hypothetical protein NW766_002134 [Fusarium irregulare]